jgi:hypothetical protein
METLPKKAFTAAGLFLLVVHFIGSIVSFVVFSYQYIREHGFMWWLFWGEVVPLLKSSVWEVFLVLALLQGSPPSPPTAPSLEEAVSRIKSLWWKAEYPALVELVGRAPNSTLKVSYRTGPEGRAEVKLSLHKKPNGGLTLRSEYPKEALFSVDRETGRKTPAEANFVITFYDANLDGIPDQTLLEPGGGKLDDNFALIQWSTGIGFSINHFLHGIKSAMPRS